MRKALLVFGVIAAFAVVYALSFGLRLGSMHIEGFFAREQASIDRTVFENTRSFRSGLSSNFERQWIEYETGNDRERQVLCAAIKRQFSRDYERLDEHQQNRYNSLPASC